MQPSSPTPLGALVQDHGVLFRVWAPRAETVDLVLEDTGHTEPMESADDGYFERFVPGLEAGSLYRYRLDDGPAFPDPASRYQPQGVHAPSQVIDPRRFPWRDDDWHGVPQSDLVFYELHVGTFSPEGTFEGARQRLPYLRELGISAVELMPVADFPGRWNWGYDPAAFYAPSRAYGTPNDLRRLVDHAHELGLAVFLDVIYNHLGPDGAYAAAFAPFFTEKHQTPWGPAINLDDRHSRGVRDFFRDNALHWLREYHFDGFRLDATHALIDDNDPHFLAELTATVATVKEGPRRIVVAEDPRNINTMLLPQAQGGMGLDAIWTDDFHHQIRNMTAGDVQGYYADYAGSTASQLAETMRQGWYYDGKPSLRTGKPRGTSAARVRHDQCVIAIQNHDQVGNRPLGDRLHHTVPMPVYRAASALLLFAPELPLLFMGQEWAASTPFQFFTDHNEELGRLVSKGRREEFRDFESFHGDVPDPQDPATFERSRLDWSERERPIHAATLRLYRDLLRLRADLDGTVQAQAHGERSLTVRRGRHVLLAALDAGVHVPLPDGAEGILDTEQPAYAPDGQPTCIEAGHAHFPAGGALIAVLPD